jgi:TonB family protein
LEDSNGGAISQQRLTPSQAMAIPAPRSSASLPVTRDARLIKHVSAEYPPSAANRGIEGVVDVALTVSRDGSVSDATVVHADPPDVFDHSAITAVRRWKYEPKSVDGVPVEARIQLRLQFKMDQHEP